MEMSEETRDKFYAAAMHLCGLRGVEPRVGVYTHNGVLRPDGPTNVALAAEDLLRAAQVNEALQKQGLDRFEINP